MTNSSSVRVAVRIRPLTENEKQQCQKSAISCIPNQQQIVVGNDRSFTFDYVYPPCADQDQVYTTCVIPLLNKFMEGYNSTILAYGQTGSGKTYSMGIGLDSVMNSTQNDGIVPRFIHSLFKSLNDRQSPHYSFQVYVSFLELHNEDLVDLLSPVKREGLNLTIREDGHGNICWSGVREESVSSPKELIGLLQKGSVARTTASTNMNNTSSRSHAIFSVILKQFIALDDNCNELTSPIPESTSLDNLQQPQRQKKLVSKFHFVDLAGSERLKRTNAVGDRAKEGISINSGLLALGNVISALGDESRKVSHIPYRDSKLTRLLQDSLGGNSQTLMLACASPADINLTETLNTLKYANRARNIRNRVAINQELGETERLKATVTRLKEELRSTDDFLRAVNDEMDSLKSEVVMLNGTVKQMATELATTKYERDCYKQKLAGDEVSNMEESIASHISSVAEYTSTIEVLRAELMQAQQQIGQLQQQVSVQSETSQLLAANNKEFRHILHHEDSSVTLVNPTSTNLNRKPHTDDSFSLEKTEKKNKRRYNHRYGSKRTKTLARRKSISASTSLIIQKQHPNMMENGRNKQWLEGIKKEMETDMEFLRSCKVHMPDIVQPRHNSWSLFNEIGRTTPYSKIRRRTVDIPLDTKTYFEAVPENTSNSIEKRNILQKLSNALDKQSMLIQHLEKIESQSQQFAKKISEVTLKKTTAVSQHKRDISEQRNQYESRLKKQQSEYQALRRKHMQTVSKLDTYKNKTQSSIDQLNKKIERLTHEKKKLLKRIKQESDRSREKMSDYDREISKMKRHESQLLSAKKKAEREVSIQKATSKRATEEIVAMGAQMKQIAAILKKAMMNSSKKRGRNNLNSLSGISHSNDPYHNLLAKAAACANVRGHLVKQSITKKSNAVASGGKLKVATLQQHAFQKKKMIHKAIYLYVQGHCNNKMIEDLCQKRTRLIQEQQELLSERKMVLKDECENSNNSEIDPSTPQYMDERIDLITVHLDTLNQQINHLLESRKDVDRKGNSEDDDSEWADIKSKDYQLGISDITDAQVAYEIALSLVRSLEPEEARMIAESLLEDLIQLKSEHHNHIISLQHLNSTVQTMQTGLVQMRRVRELLLPFQKRWNEHNNTSSIDQDKNHYELHNQLISQLDSSFIKTLHSPIYMEYGLVLPKDSNSNNDMLSLKPKRLMIPSPTTPTVSLKSPGYSSNLKDPHFKSCLPIFSGSSRLAVSRAESAPSLLVRLTEDR